MAETCQLALQRIERERDGAAAAGGDEASPYLSVDPMQAAPADTPTPQVVIEVSVAQYEAPVSTCYCYIKKLLQVCFNSYRTGSALPMHCNLMFSRCAAPH